MCTHTHTFITHTRTWRMCDGSIKESAAPCRAGVTKGASGMYFVVTRPEVTVMFVVSFEKRVPRRAFFLGGGMSYLLMV